MLKNYLIKLMNYYYIMNQMKIIFYIKKFKKIKMNKMKIKKKKLLNQFLIIILKIK